MKKPESCENLEDVRRGIDALDREIVALLGMRSRYVEAAAQFKTSEQTSAHPNARRRCSKSGVDGPKKKA